ncbi:hypothetical protein ACH5RR_021558, partial [Cinchona calisaya]
MFLWSLVFPVLSNAAFMIHRTLWNTPLFIVNWHGQLGIILSISSAFHIWGFILSFINFNSGGCTALRLLVDNFVHSYLNSFAGIS